MTIDGDTIGYPIEALPGATAIPLGLLEKPRARAPAFSMEEGRKHDRLAITGDVERWN